MVGNSDQFNFLSNNDLRFFYSVCEAKDIWKKAKDTHRYFSTKPRNQAKSGAAAPDDPEIELADDESQCLLDEMAFIDESAAAKHRQTVSLGGFTPISRPSTSTSAVSLDSTNDTPACLYDFTPKSSHNRNDPVLDAAQTVGKSISSFIENQAERNKTYDLKYFHIWLHLDKMFQELDDTSVLDLNFAFVQQAYEAIRKAKEKQNET